MTKKLAPATIPALAEYLHDERCTWKWHTDGMHHGEGEDEAPDLWRCSYRNHSGGSVYEQSARKLLKALEARGLAIVKASAE